MRPDGVQDTNDMVATSKDLALDSDVILGFFRCESHEFATLIYYNLFEGCALHVIGWYSVWNLTISGTSKDASTSLQSAYN